MWGDLLTDVVIPSIIRSVFSNVLILGIDMKLFGRNPFHNQVSFLIVWRCTVCGYLAAREAPPLECPVCWATQDRFELLS